LAAIETGGPIGRSRRPSRDRGAFPSFIPVEKVEREEDDQEEKDANGPEKALPEGVPVLLGVKKNPEGHDQRYHIKEDEKETHGFSPKKLPAFSAQLSANNPDDLGKSLLERHPGEPRIKSGAGAGVHPAKGGIEITGFRLPPE
jgi:hypothetical protein